MARALRLQFPGAIYHVTTRGNERRDIFRGAGGVRGLFAVTTDEGMYLPTFDANGNVSEYIGREWGSPFGGSGGPL